MGQEEKMMRTLRLSMNAGQSGHKRLTALAAFAPGDTLSAFRGITRQKATRYTLQVGVSEHILLEPEILQYTNHSCDPNVVFDVLRMTVRAIRPIAPGDEIVYFYPSTEWDMAEPFVCACGAACCLRRIQGAAHLPPDVLGRYELQPHIQDQLMRRINAPQTYSTGVGK
jgi:hypothetical protein